MLESESLRPLPPLLLLFLELLPLLMMGGMPARASAKEESGLGGVASWAICAEKHRLALPVKMSYWRASSDAMPRRYSASRAVVLPPPAALRPRS
jgi:hypothetical protein